VGERVREIGDRLVVIFLKIEVGERVWERIHWKTVK
jgi:hypothetical protein